MESLEARRGRHPAFWLLYAAGLLIALTIAILVSPAARDGTIGTWESYPILFLGVFPLFNALADFASIGLTWHLLRKGLEQTTWAKALADLAGGETIFAALGVALITYIHFVRFPDGAPLLDLGALFDGLRDAPGDHWWLFAMLFSTLIPTLLHGMVGLYTVLLHYPAPVRRWVFVRLEAGGLGSDTEGWWGSLGYCAMLTVSIWVPLLGTWILFTADHGAVLRTVIGGFRLYAEAIGAI